MRISSRKRTYRMGEMLTLDVAVRNVGDEPIFAGLVAKDDLSISVVYPDGKEAFLKPYVDSFRLWSVDDYIILEGGEMTIGSVDYLVGCGDAEYKRTLNREADVHELSSTDPAKYWQAIFEEDLYASWGYGCLDVREPGKVTLVCERMCDRVLISSTRPRVRSAIGTIQSQPLTFEISD